MSPDIELWNVCRSAFHSAGNETGAATRKRRAILHALRDTSQQGAHKEQQHGLIETDVGTEKSTVTLQPRS